MNKAANHNARFSLTALPFSGTALAKSLAVASVALLIGCTSGSGKWGFPYRAPTQQGNWVTAEQVSYLRPGLTQDQVLYALGTPTLVDIFRPNRWDYPYHFKPGYGAPVHRNLSLWFDENGLLERWEHDPLPNSQPADFATQRALGTAHIGGESEIEVSSTPTEGVQTTPLAD